MPADQQLDAVPTVIHELGHTFGLDDLYNADNDFPPEITVRDIGPLDTMSENFDVPHFSMPNRMRLNWVAPDWIERFDFSRDPSGHEVTLQAAESLERSGPRSGDRPLA